MPKISFESGYAKITNVGMGCMNIHVPLTFDDGVTGLARIRNPPGAQLSRENGRLITESDYQTLRVLGEVASKWVPAAWMPPRNDLLSYFFVQRIEGGRTTSREDFRAPRPAWLERTARDFAAFFIGLEKARFSGVGSLCAPATPEGGDNVTSILDSLPPVGPIFHPWTTFASAHPLGPFKTSAEHYLAKINHCLRLIADGLMNRDFESLGRPTWMEPEECNPVLAYCVYLEMRHLVSGCKEMHEEGPTYIKHGDDDQCNHLLIADDGSLVAVLDWEFAFLAPFREAFTAHESFAPDEYSNGSNALSHEELALIDEYEKLGRNDMADAVRGGRKYHRLASMIGRGDDAPWRIEEIWGLRDAFLGADDPEPRPATLQDFVASAKVKFAADPGLQALMARHPTL